MPIIHPRRMNLVALALLITALIAFVAFHFLIVEIYTDPGMLHHPGMAGWQIWPSLVHAIKDFPASNGHGMIAISAFVTHALMVIACPSLVGFLRISRVGWWITIIPSGMAMCGLGGIILMEPGDPSFSIPGPGIFCLLASLALNVLGLLLIRREIPAAPYVDPA